MNLSPGGRHRCQNDGEACRPCGRSGNFVGFCAFRNLALDCAVMRTLILFALLLAGAFVLLWGLVHDSMLAFVGVIESLLFVPAVVLIRTIRRENMALRMLGIPLRKAKTAEEAAKVLMRYFASAHQLANETNIP